MDDEYISCREARFTNRVSYDRGQRPRTYNRHNRVVKSLIAYKDTYVPRINFHVTTCKVDACRELASIYSCFRDTRSTINIGLPPPTCALGRQFYFKLHVQFEDRSSLAPVL